MCSKIHINNVTKILKFYVGSKSRVVVESEIWEEE